IAYASYKKPTSITRGTTTIGFSHDPEHQRFQQTAPGGTTLYLGGAEKFTGSGRRRALDQLPDGGRRPRRHARGEQPRERLDALPPPSRGQASTRTTSAPSPSSPTRP